MAKIISPEKNVHLQVCEWLKWQYPRVLFHTDFGAGCKLTIGQAVMQKKMQKITGFPDLFILESRQGYNGLFLELKRLGTKLKKKDGTPATPHIADQLNAHIDLTARGYKCRFAVGFDEAVKIISDYLN